MRTRGHVIGAIVRRELAGYFSTPTGYVFISLFVFLSAVAAFWQDRFFANNLANLDQLNRYFPYLLVFFIPAIAMSLWADERRQGTEELLLTLPTSDWQVVLGKYFAGVAIYTVSLLFSASHIVVLRWLGNPDPGLMLATYAGYWLAGAALLAVAMLASLLTDNLTVAFIAGGLLCAALVFLDQAGAIGLWFGPGSLERVAARLSTVEQLRDLLSGAVTLHALIYFAGIAAVALYLNTALLGRRRWPTGPKAPHFARHYLLRVIALVAAVGSLTLLVSQTRLRWDATSEKIHSLSAETIALLKGLDPQQPVFVYAYFSPEVPRSYVEARNALVGMLREFEAAGGEAIHSRIIETLKYSPAAREAEERYNIRPYRVPATEESAGAMNEIFLGLVFTRGSEEFVIPFFDRGLPAEYELVRSIRVVSRAKRKKIGILNTPVQLFGGFDFQSKRQSQEWSIVTELRKQYEVAQVSPDADYPGDLDALLAAQPSALTQPQADRLTAYVKTGKPVLLMLDSMPAFNLDLAPQDVQQQASPFQMQQPPPQSPKANLRPMLDAAGVTWTANRIAWDNYNPHPQLKNLPKEFVFVAKGFNPKEPVTAGLQEMVLLYPGTLQPRSDAPGEVIPLLETSGESGAVRWAELVQRNFLGGVAINQNLQHTPEESRQVLAVRVKGPVNAVIVADVDLMGEQFFELRRRGIENLNFDNVTFLLNAVDELAGDTSFIALRKRRPRHRTLEAVEARTRAYETQRLEEMRQAEAIAEARLKEAQARLDKAVREIEQRKDLDDQAKQVMIANVQAVENRRLQVARTTIEDEKQRQIDISRADMENSIRGIQNTIRLMAVMLPPIPAVLLFLAVSVRRLARERIGVPVDRLIEERHT
jgi:gliding motility-associated transport system permease protein/gliding motility-associatede transport system auxiliary component